MKSRGSGKGKKGYVNEAPLQLENASNQAKSNIDATLETLNETIGADNRGMAAMEHLFAANLNIINEKKTLTTLTVPAEIKAAKLRLEQVTSSKNSLQNYYNYTIKNASTRDINIISQFITRTQIGLAPKKQALDYIEKLLPIETEMKHLKEVLKAEREAEVGSLQRASIKEKRIAIEAAMLKALKTSDAFNALSKEFPKPNSDRTHSSGYDILEQGSPLDIAKLINTWRSEILSKEVTCQMARRTLEAKISSDKRLTPDTAKETANIRDTKKEIQTFFGLNVSNEEAKQVYDEKKKKASGDPLKPLRDHIRKNMPVSVKAMHPDHDVTLNKILSELFDIQADEKTNYLIDQLSKKAMIDPIRAYKYNMNKELKPNISHQPLTINLTNLTSGVFNSPQKPTQSIPQIKADEPRIIEDPKPVNPQPRTEKQLLRREASRRKYFEIPKNSNNDIINDKSTFDKEAQKNGANPELEKDFKSGDDKGKNPIVTEYDLMKAKLREEAQLREGLEREANPKKKLEQPAPKLLFTSNKQLIEEAKKYKMTQNAKAAAFAKQQKISLIDRISGALTKSSKGKYNEVREEKAGGHDVMRIAGSKDAIKILQDNKGNPLGQKEATKLLNTLQKDFGEQKLGLREQLNKNGKKVGYSIRTAKDETEQRKWADKANNKGDDKGKGKSRD
jgi:hypothetical protein